MQKFDLNTEMSIEKVCEHKASSVSALVRKQFMPQCKCMLHYKHSSSDQLLTLKSNSVALLKKVK